MRIVSLGLLALLGLGVGVAQAAPVAAPVVVEQNGLRISISSTRRAFSDDNTIELGTIDPTLLVVLQNTTGRPLNIWDQGCELGNYSLTLEIAKINGRVLPEPLVVRRNGGTWFANGRFAETVDEREAIVRSVSLFMPDDVIKNSTVPVRQSLEPLNWNYFGFPFPNSSAPVRLTMRAVFSNTVPTESKEKPIWTGKIASPWKDYLVSW